MHIYKTTLAVLLLAGTTFTASIEDASAAVAGTNTSATYINNTQVQQAPSSTGVISGPVDAEADITSKPSMGFTNAQESRIGEITKEYLLAHPDVLLEVSSKLETQQQMLQLTAMTQAALRHQDALLNDKSNPSYGPDDAKVVFIEFFDYQCSVCARQAPIISSLMKANPHVRYVYREWPIFAQRWEPSLSAAKMGLQIWKQKGAEAYLAYHNAIFAIGHNEGKLTQKDITDTAAQIGRLKGKYNEMLEELSTTDALAQNLGLRGTPGMIVMPVSGATEGNVTVIPGGADFELLQSAIDKANHI
ncbi:DSBA oxidoreductase (plasmid) [Serratia marcescens]|nr:DSBA oxidoreductase [Serratia marcescens]